MIMIENGIYCYVNVFWIGILVKRVVTSLETRNFLERFAFLIWETKDVPIDETVRRSLGN